MRMLRVPPVRCSRLRRRNWTSCGSLSRIRFRGGESLSHIRFRGGPWHGKRVTVGSEVGRIGLPDSRFGRGSYRIMGFYAFWCPETRAGQVFGLVAQLIGYAITLGGLVLISLALRVAGLS